MGKQHPLDVFPFAGSFSALSQVLGEELCKMRAASTLLKRLKTVLVDSLSTRQTDKHNNHNFRPGHVPCPSLRVKLLSIRDSAVLLEWLGLALRKMR